MTDYNYFKPGEKAKFNYPKEFTTLPDYSKRRGQIVTVIRTLDASENDIETNGPMYLIETKDGWLGHAFDDELKRI